MASSRTGEPVVRPKLCRYCLICKESIPLAHKAYHSLQPRPNNPADAQKKEELKKSIQQIVGDIVDFGKSHVMCDACNRKIISIQKAEKQKASLRCKYSTSTDEHSTKTPEKRTPTKMIQSAQVVGPERMKRMSYSPYSMKSPSTTRPTKIRAVAVSPRKTTGSKIPKPVRLCDKENTPLSTMASSPSRIPRLSPRRSPISRTTLFTDQHADKTESVSAEVTIFHAGIRKKRPLTKEWVPVAEALYHKNEDNAAKEAVKISSVKACALSDMLQGVQRECSKLCAKESHSSFKLSSPADLENWSPTKQDNELAEKAPILHSILNASAINETQLAKNKLKNRAAVQHGILSAAGVLLNCRNKDVNAHQVMTGLQLKHGGASQKTFDRLQKRFLSINHETQTKVQDAFTKDFDKDVKEWAKQMLEDAATEDQLKKRIQAASGEEADKLKMELDYHNKTRHPGYCLVGDNVDMKTHARYMGIGSQNRDMHMFNMLAVENRIGFYHLPNDKPVAHIDDVPLKSFLPGIEDNQALKNVWIVHVSKIIAKYLPQFQWLTNELPDVIPHQYSQEAKKKTKVVQLGVIDKNESTHEGMRDITEHMHKYVPEDGEGDLIRILSVGDQLTVERQCAAQEDVRDSKTPAKRREGLMPVTGDFHLLGNFYQCIWKKVYHRGSVGDIGTLYASTKVMESHNVPQNPMKDINATKVFLDKYTEALVVAAALEYFGMESVESEPSCHKFDISEHKDSANYIKVVLGKFVDEFALPEEADISGASGHLKCPKCFKTYSLMDGLRDHLKKDHKAGDEDQDTHDGIFAHSCAVLTMCLICHDFTDARQCGDGERIMRLMKYMLLYFRSAGKTKYALQVFRQLAQVKCFLTPREAHHVMHNRFVNTKGRKDTNVELDRACEACNLVFKTHARNLHGQVTQNAIDRVSRSCQAIDRVLKGYDNVCKRRPSSSKRGGRDHSQDVLKLVGHLVHDRVFYKDSAGRYHKNFPGFTRGYVVNVDHVRFHEWMARTLEDLSRKNIFRKHVCSSKE